MMLEFDIPGIGEAHQKLAGLLWLGAISDRRQGPRWMRLTNAELFEHLDAHLARVRADLTSRDGVTGYQDAAHLAARALMLLQRAIEHERQENGGKSIVDRSGNDRP